MNFLPGRFSDRPGPRFFKPTISKPIVSSKLSLLLLSVSAGIVTAGEPSATISFNPDGQGFAAFGRVVKGMDVVRKIHARETDGQKLRKPVPIQRIIRQN